MRHYVVFAGADKTLQELWAKRPIKCYRRSGCLDCELNQGGRRDMVEKTLGYVTSDARSYNAKRSFDCDQPKVPD